VSGFTLTVGGGTGTYYGGGICSRSHGAIIENCLVDNSSLKTPDVATTGTVDVGGICGSAEALTAAALAATPVGTAATTATVITGCVNRANISTDVSAPHNIGGILGLTVAGSSSIIAGCYNAGTLGYTQNNGNATIGGIVGGLSTANGTAAAVTISGCFNIGTVTSGPNAGPLSHRGQIAGSVSATSALIENTYYTSANGNAVGSASGTYTSDNLVAFDNAAGWPASTMAGWGATPSVWDSSLATWVSPWLDYGSFVTKYPVNSAYPQGETLTPGGN